MSITDERPPVCALLDTLLPPLLRSLCRYPNDLQVSIRHTSRSSDVLIRPHDDDFPLLLGTNAKTFNSFRLICRAIADKHRHPIELEKLQGGRARGAEKVTWPEIPVDPTFDIKPIQALLQRTLAAFTQSCDIQVERDGVSWRIVVTVSATEPTQHDLEICSALTTIFNASAKLRGGDLRVLYTRSHDAIVTATEASDQQPVTAAGRYAKEL